MELLILDKNMKYNNIWSKINNILIIILNTKLILNKIFLFKKNVKEKNNPYINENDKALIWSNKLI